MRRIGCNFALIAAMGLAASEAFAQPGPYISQQLGVVCSPNLNVDADANDPGSICDEFVNPFRDVMPAACQGMDAPRTEWMTPFTGGRGVVTSGAFGYRFGRLRTEVEYLFNDASHNDTADILGRGTVAQTKLGSEVVLAEDRLGNVQAHSVFGNVMIDLPNSSRVTPYVGAGAGVMPGCTTACCECETAPEPDHVDRGVLPGGPHGRSHDGPAQPCRDRQQRAGRCHRHGTQLPGGLWRGHRGQ
ncbi:MAG: hypothetical protein OXH69_01395 [Acidobacteria bacterium]|nr:hypothetical protein [Acidobacteriota bacterium]